MMRSVENSKFQAPNAEMSYIRYKSEMAPQNTVCIPQKKSWQSKGGFCHSFALKFMRNNKYRFWIIFGFITLLAATGVNASEADIHIPSLDTVNFNGLGGMKGTTLMYIGLVICLIGAVFGYGSAPNVLQQLRDLPPEVIGRQDPEDKPVTIGDGCWLGVGSVILPGTTLGRNVAVAAGAVVRGSFPDHCLIGGVPARVLRRHHGDESGWRGNL